MANGRYQTLSPEGLSAELQQEDKALAQVVAQQAEVSSEAKAAWDTLQQEVSKSDFVEQMNVSAQINLQGLTPAEQVLFISWLK